MFDTINQTGNTFHLQKDIKIMFDIIYLTESNFYLQKDIVNISNKI